MRDPDTKRTLKCLKSIQKYLKYLEAPKNS